MAEGSQPLPEMSDREKEELFAWVDEFKLSRPKKNFTRDFSDGVLTAEILKNFFPKHVEIHNYINANSVQQKMSNWDTLNRKVMSKMNYQIPRNLCERICKNESDVVEVFLFDLKTKLEQHQDRKGKGSVGKSTTIAGQNGTVNGNSFAGGPSGSQSNMLDLNVHNPMPLSQLDLTNIDVETRLILSEKEQALLASQETVGILNTKVKRLEHLLSLKDQRIEEQRRGISELQQRLQQSYQQ